MSDQAQQSPVETANPTSPAVEKTETQRPAGRLSMPQDVRYCTEQDDRVKLAEKYEQYKVSDVDACHVRFLTDNRQKRNLFGQNEEERTSVQSLSKTCRVNIFPGYQQATKHSYKIFGAEADVRKCLVEVMERMFKRPNRSKRDVQSETEVSTEKDADDQTPYATPSALGETENKETPSTTGDETLSAATEETKATEPAPATGDEESAAPPTSTTEEQIDSNSELKSIPSAKEPTKYVPLERKPQWTFITLISSQGQEVLKKNWSFFAGSLQQRLDVVVMNPVKLSKFGDKQIQNELPITGESIENITDAVLQITAFINDVLGIPTQPFNFDEEAANADQYQTPDSQHNRTPLSRNRNGAFEQTILIRSDCVPRVVGTRASNLKRIQNKCRLREIIVARQANENGYVECTLSAFQIRNIHFAINTIRNSLRNEGERAVLVHEANHGDDFPQNSPRVHELVPPNTEQTPTEAGHSSEEIGFLPNTLQFHNNKSYPQPSYNFQNTPSFDFTHQATSAARKTDKRRGELHDSSRTPSEAHSSHYESLGLNSPRQKTKRACPETKEIDCTTDEGFWIQKQYYYALDDASKQLFDSLIEKVEKIRIASEENASRKQQRLVGRNKCNKSKAHSSTVSYLTEGNQLHQKEPIVKATQFDSKDNVDPSTEEKENKQETSTVVAVNQD